MGELEKTPQEGFGDVSATSSLGEIDGASCIDLMIVRSFSDVMYPLFSSSNCTNIWSIS